MSASAPASVLCVTLTELIDGEHADNDTIRAGAASSDERGWTTIRCSFPVADTVENGQEDSVKRAAAASAGRTSVSRGHFAQNLPEPAVQPVVTRRTREHQNALAGTSRRRPTSKAVDNLRHSPDP